MATCLDGPYSIWRGLLPSTYKRCFEGPSRFSSAQGPTPTAPRSTTSLIVMIVATLLANVLLASAVLARPSLKNRIERRKAGAHQSRPLNRIIEDGKTNHTNVEYSSNWAGAVYNSAAGTYKSVTAEFVVPTPSASGLGLLGTYSASAWVGASYGSLSAEFHAYRGLEFCMAEFLGHGHRHMQSVRLTRYRWRLLRECHLADWC